MPFLIHYANAIASTKGELMILKVDELIGPVDDRLNVGSDKILSVADTDQKGSSITHAQDRVRFGCVEDHERVGAAQPGRTEKMACSKVFPDWISRSNRCATTSESVSLRVFRPEVRSSFLSSA